MSITIFADEEQRALEEKTTLPRFLFFPLCVLGFVLIATSWPVDHWAVRAGWILFTSYWMFCWMSCFHETAHQTLCGSRTFSIWLGRFLGTAMWVPYTTYRESHIRHHAYLNKPTDWELWPYCDPDVPLWFRRVFVWVDLLLGFVTAPAIYGRTFFHRNSPIRSKQLRRKIVWEYVGIAVGWGTIIGFVAWYDKWMGLLLVWIAPHWLAGIWQNARKLTEHLGMASYDPLQGTRTVLGENWFTRLCTFLNFDIFVHGPHHRHPRLAHDRLRQKMVEYADENPDTPYPLFKSYWRATLAGIPWMVRNPGVGMNVGAPSPEMEKDTDVRNFVGDVNVEILADS
ncbi:MAG: fatty acid desaturase family protein [Planctomycetaceae bacterium]